MKGKATSVVATFARRWRELDGPYFIPQENPYNLSEQIDAPKIAQATMRLARVEPWSQPDREAKRYAATTWLAHVGR
jgi:hypothetical protein